MSVSKLAQLKAATNRKEFAELIGIPPANLTYALYKIEDKEKYAKFVIAKKTGGQRHICAPISRLKYIQSRVSELLYHCYDELHEKPKQATHFVSHAFQKNRDLWIGTNAYKHKSKRYVFNVDLQDFFSTINFGRVRGYFIKNKHFSLCEEVATTIAQICCHENKLPQGAPTSPIVSELIAGVLDVRLVKFAKQHGCTYSRYADDLTFSTNKPKFPSEIAIHSKGQASIASPQLEKIISNSGFALNPAKTRLQFNNERQEATGLTVNKKVNYSKQYYKQVRQLTHELVTKGSCYIKISSGDQVEVTTSTLHGKLAFLFHLKTQYENNKIINKKPRPKTLADFDKNKQPHIYKLYAKFLYYTKFCANEKPLIICEGKTDYIYLSAAIKSLADDFPQLVDNSNPKKKTPAFDFLRYSPTITSVMNLTGGASTLHDFLRNYKTATSKLHKPSNRQPVVMVVDNDGANKGLWDILKKDYCVVADGSENYIKVYENLYIVPIPKINSGDTYIEHLLKPKTLKIPYNGMTLHMKTKRGERTPEGKMSKAVFAEKIIKRSPNGEDFSGFKPILTNISEVIIKHF